MHPEEYELLQLGQDVSTQSRLVELAPEYDPVTCLIRVGGRLGYSEDLELETIHPIVLDPKNPITKLLIADLDSTLCHPGPQRVFAQVRRKHWVLHGRQAVKSVQRLFCECRRWKGFLQSLGWLIFLPLDSASISRHFGQQEWTALALSMSV